MHPWPLDVFHCGRTGLEHLAPTAQSSVRIPLPSFFRRISGAAVYSGSGASPVPWALRSFALWVATLGGGALDLLVLLLAACWPLLALWTTTSSRWTSCSGRLRLGGGLRPNFFLEVFLTDFLGGVKPLPRPRDRRLPGGGLHPRGAHDGREEG